MDLKLSGRKALITGASSGLGAAAALALAEEGVHIFINSRSEENLIKTADNIYNKTKIKAEIVPADVATADGIEKIKNTVSEIDILVSNAGGPPPGQFTEHDPQIWENARKLVLDSAVNLTQMVIDHMIKQKWGRLIYITSVGALQPIDDLVLSNTYRAAVTGMCKTVSNNYGKYGITANCVCPGFTATERLTALAKSRAEKNNQTEEEILEGFSTLTSAKRIGQPEELAALITFLASDKAAYITGTSIPVDGGFIKALI